MISASPSSEFVLAESARALFVKMLPEIREQLDFRFQHLTPELREEETAAAVALAFEMFVRLVRCNKTELAYPTPLADYASRQVSGGRQCGTPLNVRDITSRHCQRKKGVRGRSLHRRDRDTGRWQEMVVEDRNASPADVAVTRIDFRNWLQTLTHMKRQIAEALAGGESTQDVAKRFRVSQGRISQIRRELMNAWNEFQGMVVPEAA